VKPSFVDYKIIKELGRGAISMVFQAEYLKDNKIYAIKEFDKAIVKENKWKRHVKKEKIIMKQVDNHFLINLTYSITDKERVWFIMPYLEGANLDKILYDMIF